MQKIYSTQNRVMLYLLQSKLSVSGINCMIRNEEPPAAGEIPPMLAWPELWVLDDGQYATALQIIQEELTHHSESKKKWLCPQCGEKLEGQFDVCWNCGYSKHT